MPWKVTLVQTGLDEMVGAGSELHRAESKIKLIVPIVPMTGESALERSRSCIAIFTLQKTYRLKTDLLPKTPERRVLKLCVSLSR